MSADPKQDSKPGFWGWVSGPHPTLKTAGMIILAIIVIAAVVKYVHWVAAAMFVFCFIIAFLMFRNMWFEGDGVKSIVFTDQPDVIDLKHIGKKKFEHLQKEGSQLPFSTTSGTPLYVIESMTETHIKFTWVHEISRLQFIRKSQTFDITVSLAEDSLFQLYRIIDIPRLLGITYAGESIRAYENDKDRGVLTLDPTSDEWIAAKARIDAIVDPLKMFKEKRDIKPEKEGDAAAE